MTDRRAIALLALLAVVPFLPALIRGEVLTFRDHGDYFIPLRHYTAERLSAGDLPLWNPYSGSGERWLANPQTAVFYPPAWLFVALPFATAYVVFLALHVALLGAGSWLLFRRWSERGAFIGAIVVMLAGPTLSLLDVSNNLATLAWIPLVLHLALSPVSTSGRAIAIALMFLGGEPLLAAIGAFAHAALFLGVRRFRSGYGEIAIVASLAAAISAAQLIPFVELVRGSDRLAGFTAADSMRNSIAPLDWLFIAVSSSSSFPPLPASQRFIPTLYLGVPALIFGLAGVWCGVKSADSRRPAAIAAMIALLATALIAAAGFIGIAGEIWMRGALNVSRYPARFAPFAAIAIGLLVALGVDGVSRLSRTERVTTLLLSALVLSSAMLRLQPLSLDAQGGRVAIAGAMLLGVGAVVLAGARLFEHRRFVVSLGIVIAADLIASAVPLFESGPFVRSIAPYDAILARDEKVLRLSGGVDDTTAHPYAANRRAWLSGYLNLLGERFDASTPAPVVSAGYLALHDLALTEPRLDLVDFLSVGALLTNREIRHPQFRREATVAGVSLYRNRSALPPVTVWNRVTWADSAEGALAKTLARSNDVRRNLVVLDAPQSFRAEARPAQEKTSWTIDEDSATIDVTTNTQAIVALNQLAASGWRVSVDGRAATPLVANALFRAVAVSPGAHRIEWSYRPRFVAIGIAISAIALVVAMLLPRFSRAKIAPAN